MIEPLDPSFVYAQTVAPGLENASPATLPVEVAAIVRYAEQLRMACEEIDQLTQDGAPYVRESAWFYMMARRVHEFTTTALEYADFETPREQEKLLELWEKTQLLYVSALGNGNALQPTQLTHPTYWRRFETTLLGAVQLLTRDPATGHNSVCSTLERLGDEVNADQSRWSFAWSLINDYLLVNHAALCERVAATSFCPGLVDALEDSLFHVGADGGTPRDDSIPDWLLAVSGNIAIFAASGPIGNPVTVHLMSLTMRAFRTRKGSQWVQQATSALANGCPEHARSAVRAHLQAGRWDQAESTMREHFSTGAFSTTLAVVTDWLGVINDINRLMSDDSSADRARAAWDLTQHGAGMTGDMWTLYSRMGPRAVRVMGGRTVQLSITDAAVRVAGAEAMEASSIAGTRATISTARGLSAVTAGRGIASMGGTLAFGFSVVNAAIELADFAGDIQRHDTVGAGFSGLRAAGSALVAVGLCFSGPAGAGLALAGLLITAAGSSESLLREPSGHVERVPLSQASLLSGWLRAMARCQSTGEGPRVAGNRQRPGHPPEISLPPSDLPRLQGSRYRYTSDLIGVRDDLDAVMRAIETLGPLLRRVFHVRDRARASHLRSRLYHLLNLRTAGSVPDELIVVGPTQEHRPGMAPTERR